MELTLRIMPLSNSMVTLYLLQTFFVLILSVVAFLLGMKYMVPEENEPSDSIGHSSEGLREYQGEGREEGS